MNRAFFAGTSLIWLLFLFCSTGSAVENTPPLSAELFLAQVRAPFQREAWVRLDGRAVQLSSQGVTKANLEVAILYAAAALQAELRLNHDSKYLIRQSYTDSSVELKEDADADPATPSLFDFGITAADVTMSFIYWDFLTEHEPENIGRFECRVMDLDHPEEPIFVRVWFAREHKFPLKVQWYNDEKDEPWRELEFKGFKRHEDLWFVKEMHLRGADWKTQVKFEDVELYLTSQKPVPKDFPLQPEDAVAPVEE